MPNGTRKTHRESPGSVGIVGKEYFTFAAHPDELELESGARLGPVTLAYETYGSLNADRSNAVLVFHALSGDSHCAGRYTPDDEKPGWWEVMVGPGKGVDTDRFFVICVNVIGGCMGSTGPASIHPKTKKPYGLAFPVISIRDMVAAQRHLIDHLEIEVLHGVIGGSMGGMQALQWAIDYPERAKSAVLLATTPRLSPQGIAFDQVGRQAIINDPNFAGGDYYGKQPPEMGLAVARMIGHITYLSDEAMHEKFGRRLKEKDKGYAYNFDVEFEVEGYLEHQGVSFNKRFDANSYLYITKAINYFNPQAYHATLAEAFRGVRSKFLVVSFTSDWLYPSYQSKEMARALMAAGAPVSFLELDTPHGHDSFLLQNDELSGIVRDFFANV
ncbi:MAG: homoserine O-acetyltransferase [Deltaproteobacteria bacterium]|nr:homoserine O-acetyltransferase [Candidatus Zymogenaceae bacterium]